MSTNTNETKPAATVAPGSPEQTLADTRPITPDTPKVPDTPNAPPPATEVDPEGVRDNQAEPLSVPDPEDTISVPMDPAYPKGEQVEIPIAPVEGITRRLVPSDFIGSGKRITELAIINAARELQIEPEMLLAFTKVEAPLGPYLPSGEPTILFEAHVFSRNTKPPHKYDDDFPTISSRSWNRALYGAGGKNQYRRMFKAAELDQRAALMACSWGSWQALGENYKRLGFKTVEDMVLYCVQSEVNQFDVFVREVKTKKGLLSALREKDFDTIAYLYNGSGYRENNYHIKLANEYQSLIANVLRRGSQGPKVVTLQKLLNKHGAEPQIKVDGWFGAATDTAVRDLQQRWGLAIDGVVGPQTYERLAAERLPDEGNPLTSKRVAGAIVTVGVGAGTVAQGTSQMNNTVNMAREIATLERLKELQDTTVVTKEVVSTAKEAAERVVGIQQGASMSLIFVGLVILVIAGYFAWTKYYDRKKAQGVE